MQQVAEVKRTRIARTLFNELELRAEWVGQPLERRTLFEPTQQIVDQPVPLSHIFEQRVVEDVEANDLFDGWNDAVETRIDELSHAVAIVVLEEGSRFGVQPPLDGGVEGNLVDAGVIQDLLFFLGREEGVAQVVVGERVQLADGRGDGCNRIARMGGKQTNTIASGGDHLAAFAVGQEVS